MIYESSWIDSMFKPTVNKHYLVSLTDNSVCIFEYQGEINGWCHHTLGHNLDGLVTAWMELPSAYQKERSEMF